MSRVPTAWITAAARRGRSGSPGRAAGHGRRAARHAVIVEATSTQPRRDAVTARRRSRRRSLDVVGGVAAHVDDAGLNQLMDESGVRVTPDVVLHSTGTTFPAASPTADTQIVGNQPDRRLGRSTPATAWASR